MTNTTPETMAFLRREHQEDDLGWRALCLALARTARGLAPLYPSALAAQHATPDAHRIGWGGVRKGHIAYFDDPNDSNGFGHIATCAGKTSDGRHLWWTNDAKRSGGVDLVADPSPAASWFGVHWGDHFVFGSDWLNGVDFSAYIGDNGDGGSEPPPKPDPDPRSHVERAVRQLRAAEDQARDAHKPKRADRLAEDRRYLVKRYNLRES